MSNSTFASILVTLAFAFVIGSLLAMNITKHVLATPTESTKVTNSVETTETAVLQDVVISDGTYYFRGNPIFLDEDCSTLLNQLLDSNISCVVPVATYVEVIDNGVQVMHLD